ncbi:hypothetical protein E1301_Tti006161 [Triplophysa tibetana]|uniref:FIIND domain-containing protein n=1 Tax=Triplophysa tibetana TaxID=1572043 RepID=A0A5A9NP91_9TELE|nr:hypothetical protein E1301_Tti006161 [Triplophysa tibetana]
MSKFRVSTEPGRYECIRTRMRWVCDCDVTLQYHVVDARSLNAQLENLKCDRVGPVIDVTVISGELEEVHLPHCVCLGNDDPSLKDAVKAISIKDEGTYEEPVQLTRFHAKIVHPSFSLKTLILRLIRRWNAHCDLLMYMSSKDPLILHVYFFPFDDHLKNAVEKEEKSSYPVKHPRPDKPFRMKTAHFLNVPGASVHPKEGITLRRDIKPNYFKVKMRLENDLEMTLIRDEEQNTVWTAEPQRRITMKRFQLYHKNQPANIDKLNENGDTDDHNIIKSSRRVIASSSSIRQLSTFPTMVQGAI